MPPIRPSLMNGGCRAPFPDRAGRRCLGGQTWRSRVRHRLMASLLRALVPEAARAILVALADGPKVQRELATALELSQVLVNQHLAPLCEHGLVESEGEGASARYRLSSLVTAVPKDGVVALTLTTDEGDEVTLEVSRGPGGRT